MTSKSHVHLLPLCTLIAVFLSLNTAQNLTNLTESVTTTEFSTTQLYTTTEVATTELATTELVTTEEATTELATTEEATTEVATTEGATTEGATTEEATTEEATTEEATTEEATTEGATSTTIEPKDDEDVIEIEIDITVTLSTNNVTIPQLTDIVTNLITQEHDGLGVLEVEIKTMDGSDGQLTITWEMVITADTESEANAVATTIESDAFKADLTTNIADKARADVLSVTTEASVITEDERPQWLDPTTYGLLNWIIVGAAACILCVICLFVMRCFYLCCNRKARSRKKKSRYQVGGPLFDSVATDEKKVSKFQNDLFNAIEMNARNSYLKKVKSASDKNLGTLKDGEVEKAFDMDFDEARPITQQSSTEEEVKDKKEKKEDDKEKGKKKKVKNELKEPLNEGVLPMVTTQKKPEDENEEVPEAPEAPQDLTNLGDYDLL